MGKMIRKILIANRGEIAVRIIRTARKLGIATVAVFSKVDELSLHVRLADESFCIGEVELNDTYLNIDKIIKAALHLKADAIHPGYGFLSENSLFVEACKKAGIIFIGPDSAVMHTMGNKIRAREFAKKLNVPVTEGMTGHPDEILAKAEKIDYPVLIKAAAGGGGKGMQIVYKKEDLAGALESASRQAKAYFDDETVYLEKYIENPRHIEFQILGDQEGNVIHLFERECTIQRRYQKIIEESPSPTLTPEIRMKMGEAAVRIGKEINYTNAGTVEFLVDQNMDFYFLEMNTRIQVEHPVTELVTGVDMVEEQIRIAEGNPLRIKQEDVHQNGHAIECRIYAEDPENNFRPSPGNITLYHTPEIPGIRIDAGIDTETEISSAFDPMISKLIVWSNDREEAITKMASALKNYIIHGIKTNLPYLAQVIEHPLFLTNDISTHFCEDHTGSILEAILRTRNEIPVQFPITGLILSELTPEQNQQENVWVSTGFWRNITQIPFICENIPYIVRVKRRSSTNFLLDFQEVPMETEVILKEKNRLTFRLNGDIFTVFLSRGAGTLNHVSLGGQIFDIRRTDVLPDSGEVSLPEMNTDHASEIFSPMPGKVIRINVNEGDEVDKGSVLMIIEAMKMENLIIAPGKAVVRKIHVEVNDRIEPGLILINLEKITSN